jgi:hypothetical protein
MNTAGSGVGVQMDDRSAGLGGIDRIAGDLLGRDRQVGRHRRRMHGAGQ